MHKTKIQIKKKKTRTRTKQTETIETRKDDKLILPNINHSLYFFFIVMRILINWSQVYKFFKLH